MEGSAGRERLVACTIRQKDEFYILPDEKEKHSIVAIRKSEFRKKKAKADVWTQRSLCPQRIVCRRPIRDHSCDSPKPNESSLVASQ